MGKQTVYSSLSDEILVERALKRGKEALGELFRRYQKPFFNLAYRFSGDYYLAEDLTSEIFWRIYRYMRTFNSRKAKFRTWAFRVGTNTCLTYKAQSHDLRLGGNEEEKPEAEIADQKIDLIKEAESNELGEKVQKALLKLPEKYRLAIYLYYFQDLSYNEVAETLNIPVNTVRTHLKRGKERMKEELKDFYR